MHLVYPTEGYCCCRAPFDHLDVSVVIACQDCCPGGRLVAIQENDGPNQMCPAASCALRKFLCLVVQLFNWETTHNVVSVKCSGLGRRI